MNDPLVLDINHYEAKHKRIAKDGTFTLMDQDIDLLLRYTVNADLAIDLGTNTGASAIVMSQNAKNVITIDLFEDAAYRESNLTPIKVNDIIQELSKFENIMVIQCSSHEFQFENFAFDQVDVIFIDADHGYDSVKKDFEHWFPKIKEGGYILFHDVDKPQYGVKRFVEKELIKYPVQLVENLKCMGVYRKQNIERTTL